MKYQAGQKVCISVNEMINGDADMDFVDVVTYHDGEETFYMLYNEFGELCCLDGEECTVDQLVTGTKDVYDLVNKNDGDIHFMLSKHDLDIAYFT